MKRPLKITSTRPSVDPFALSAYRPTHLPQLPPPVPPSPLHLSHLHHHYLGSTGRWLRCWILHQHLHYLWRCWKYWWIFWHLPHLYTTITYDGLESDGGVVKYVDTYPNYTTVTYDGLEGGGSVDEYVDTHRLLSSLPGFRALGKSAKF